MTTPPLNNPEDEALWAEITKDIRKLPEQPAIPGKPVKLPPVRPSVNLAAAYHGETLEDLRIGNTDSMDGSLAKRFKREEFRIEAELDLHGFREDEACNAVYEFVQKAYLSGKRCIIIITGKGLSHNEANTDYYNPRGKLKEIVPVWLNSRELRPLILGCIHPSAKLGGTGALYILLRRRRED